MPEDKRIVKTRALLRSTLQDLVAERSFETVTVKQICEKAAVSRVTFYSHFPDKYALLNNLYSDFLSKVLQRCIDKTRLSGRERRRKGVQRKSVRFVCRREFCSRQTGFFSRDFRRKRLRFARL